MSNPLTLGQKAETAARDRAVRAALFAVDDAMLPDQETARAISAMPAAYRARIAVEAAVGYLIGQGLITVRPEDDWPGVLRLETPPHLRPDVAGMIRRSAEMRAAVDQRFGGTNA